MQKAEENKWSDSKKFWMDLFKSLLTFIIVALITAAFLERYNSRVLYKRTYTIVKQNQFYQLARDFDHAYQYYLGVSYEAKKDREAVLKEYIPRSKIWNYVCRDNVTALPLDLVKNPKNLLEFEGLAYWNYKEALNMIPSLVDTTENKALGEAIRRSLELSTKMYCKYVTDASRNDFQQARDSFRNASNSLVALLRAE